MFIDAHRVMLEYRRDTDAGYLEEINVRSDAFVDRNKSKEEVDRVRRASPATAPSTGNTMPVNLSAA